MSGAPVQPDQTPARRARVPSALPGLVRTDVLRTRRDPLLLLLGMLPLAITIAYAAGFARVQSAVPPQHGALVHTIAIATLLLITPLMFGFVTGLMLLDERDDGVLAAVAATPVGRTGFVAYRTAVPIVWSGLVAATALALAGHGIVIGARAVLLVLLSAWQAPLVTLFLGAFAGNKVEGMAMGKVANVVVALGALGVLLPRPWLWLAAASPHFWLVFVLLAPRLHPPHGVAAMGAHAGVLLLLARAFARHPA